MGGKDHSSGPRCDRGAGDSLERGTLDKAVLYIHGKNGDYLEAGRYGKNCPGFDVIGVDYRMDLPWMACDQIQAAHDRIRRRYDRLYVIANSVGAYFAMVSLGDCNVEKALFISPVLDMEQLIRGMMDRAGVSEAELREKKEIRTDFGEMLSWEYLRFVREHPITWDIPTEILYGGDDDLVPRQTVDRFVHDHGAGLTILEKGGHWFHTDEQVAFLDDWMRVAILV